MKHVWIFLLGALVGNALFSQISLERQVIASTGSSTQVGTVHFSATVGETVTATGLSQSGSLVLTQGFQQPDPIGTTAKDQALQIELDYELFPNPTADEITLRFRSDQPLTIQYSLFDLRGRSVGIPAQQLLIQGESQRNLSLRALADGLYHLRILGPDGQLLHTFTIQKRQN